MAVSAQGDVVGGGTWVQSGPVGVRSLVDPQWMMDPKLELWVDAEREPVVIRLAGTLDGSTAASVLAVIGELLDQGSRQFVLDATSLDVVDSEGAASLIGIEMLVGRFDGRIVRVGT